MTDIDLDAIRARWERREESDDDIVALFDAVQRRDDALAAVLALCDDMERHTGEAIAYDGVARVARLTTDSIRAAITAHLAPADNPTTED